MKPLTWPFQCAWSALPRWLVIGSRARSQLTLASFSHGTEPPARMSLVERYKTTDIRKIMKYLALHRQITTDIGVSGWSMDHIEQDNAHVLDNSRVTCLSFAVATRRLPTSFHCSNHSEQRVCVHLRVTSLNSDDRVCFGNTNFDRAELVSIRIYSFARYCRSFCSTSEHCSIIRLWFFRMKGSFRIHVKATVALQLSERRGA